MSKKTSDVILERIMRLHPKVIDLKLNRVEHLLKKLGNPEKNLPPVIHIAGTNGKGSTQAIIKAGLEAEGKRVHSYTSPHLAWFHERITVAGKIITDSSLSQILDECYQVNANSPITYFEMTTVAAILAFSRTKADFCILEVGLGGRFDATNVINSPEVCIITPISLDHQSFLGETLQEIAFEKAGILKTDCFCVVSSQDNKVLDVLKTEAERCKATLKVFGEDWSVLEKDSGFSFEDSVGVCNLPLPALIGSHQVQNAGAALVALRHLGVSESSFRQAMTNVVWPARMQRLKSGPFVDILIDSEIWLDGGHNPAAAEVLAKVLASLEPKPTYLICGMLNTKDVLGYMAYLTSSVDELFSVAVPGELATLTAKETADYAVKAGIKASQAESLEDALKKIMIYSKSSRVVICGSLYLAGFVLRSHT